ncbi:MAG: hypothetical protein DSZ11_03665, partial [Sulfurovum sp.]
MKTETTKKIEKKDIKLNAILKNKTYAWLILTVSIALMFIDNFLKIKFFLIGGWDIIMSILILIPLAYLIWKKELTNPHIKWVFPLLLLMIWDMFYYNNDLVQHLLPIIFYLMVITLYLNSMQQVHSFYQTLIPIFSLPWRGVAYIRYFLENLLVKESDKRLYSRIFFAILITIPFLVVFVSLLFSADENFRGFLTQMFDFKLGFNMKYF